MRDLPSGANLEHLKKQAKDLLDMHKSADPEALAPGSARPSRRCAALSPEAIAAAPFALHDAQSAIAREYGKASWVELRDAVAAQAQDPGPSDALLRVLMPLPFPPEVGAILRDMSRDVPSKRAMAATAAEAALPALLPAVTLRNALFLPRAVGPIHVARPSSLAAIDLALGRMPPTLAVFAQRAEGDESPDAAALHPIGCQVYVHARVADGADRAWIVLEGMRWIELTSLEAGPRGTLAARVNGVSVDPGDPAEVGPLAEALRAHARDLVAAFPDAPRLLAIVDAAGPEHLADLIVANLPVPVDEKARYASELRLAERLRIATSLAKRIP